ncbi:hypothetical protein EBU24_03275 [bacterium]|nr:hypothetical protein [bacterium]
MSKKLFVLALLGALSFGISYGSQIRDKCMDKCIEKCVRSSRGNQGKDLHCARECYDACYAKGISAGSQSSGSSYPTGSDHGGNRNAGVINYETAVTRWQDSEGRQFFINKEGKTVQHYSSIEKYEADTSQAWNALITMHDGFRGWRMRMHFQNGLVHWSMGEDKSETGKVFTPEEFEKAMTEKTGKICEYRKNRLGQYYMIYTDRKSGEKSIMRVVKDEKTGVLTRWLTIE